jgi:hypothetical protein
LAAGLCAQGLSGSCWWPILALVLHAITHAADHLPLPAQSVGTRDSTAAVISASVRHLVSCHVCPGVSNASCSARLRSLTLCWPPPPRFGAPGRPSASPPVGSVDRSCFAQTGCRRVTHRPSQASAPLPLQLAGHLDGQEHQPEAHGGLQSLAARLQRRLGAGHRRPQGGRGAGGGQPAERCQGHRCCWRWCCCRH